MAQQLNTICSKFQQLTDYNPDIFVYDDQGKTGEERLILGLDADGNHTELGKVMVINDKQFQEQGL
jgi:hypothetical protein